MNSDSDQKLLKDYAGRRDEAAFTELVRRHASLVFSAALRMVGDSHLAEDVAQGVFVALARSADQLRERPVLSGWLHRTTQNIAAQTVRSDVRRRAREQEAAVMNQLLSTDPDAIWEQIAPRLDAGLGELSETDRDALFLRYFERKSAKEIAQTLGTSEQAAQKRVSRAVEKLRELLAKRGITVSAGGLVVILSANAVKAAPPALVAALSSAALATAVSGAAASSTVKFIAATKLQTAVFSAIVLVSVVTPLWVQHQAQARSLDQDRLLRQQRDQLAQLAAENERLSKLPGGANRSAENGQLAELLALRGEAESLRSQTKGMATLREENRRLRPPAPPAQPTDFQTKELMFARQGYAQGWANAFHAYARANQGRFPGNFAQAEPYWFTSGINSIFARKGTGLTSDRFEILYHGTLDSLTKIAPKLDVIVFREKNLWPAVKRDGSVTQGREDAMASGIVQYASSDPGALDESFSDYEKAHIASTYKGDD